MNYCVFLFLLPVTSLFSQTAKIYADSTDLWHMVGRVESDYISALEMEFKINGKSFHFGSAPVEVKADPNVLDTLFYKQTLKSKWDTILCNIEEPITYRLYFNMCCNAFNAVDEKGLLFRLQINFRITGTSGNKTYLGRLGNAAILVNPANTDTLKDNCWSRMIPNIYPISFSEIAVCEDSAKCTEACLFEKGKNEFDYNFSYKKIADKLDIPMFMPLKKEPIEITYDTVTGEIVIR